MENPSINIHYVPPSHRIALLVILFAHTTMLHEKDKMNKRENSHQTTCFLLQEYPFMEFCQFIYDSTLTLMRNQTLEIRNSPDWLSSTKCRKNNGTLLQYTCKTILDENTVKSNNLNNEAMVRMPF